MLAMQMLLVGFLPFVAIVLQGCSGTPKPFCVVTGSGNKTTLTPTLDGAYTKLSVADSLTSGLQADVSIGATDSFSMEVYDNVKDWVDIIVKDGILSLEAKIDDKGNYACNLGAMATITVTTALQSASAFGATVTIDQLDGSASSRDGASITIAKLGGSEATITATDTARVNVSSGSVPVVTLEVRDGSIVELGDLSASTSASMTVADRSTLTGMTTPTLTIQARDHSNVNTEVTGTVSGTCKDHGSVTISGGAQASGVTASDGCVVSAASIAVVV